MNPRRRPLRASVIVVAATLVAVLGTASAAHADPVYPSWDDVLAARASEAATASEIARVQEFIDDLETEATALSVTALEKGEAYNQAAEALATATSRAERLQAEADAATAEAEESAAQAGQLVSQLVRTGGGNITVQLLVNSSDADDLLSQLGTMSKLTEQSARVLRQAETDRNTAQALTDQATIARAGREELAAEAEAVLAEANAAAAEAEEKIAAQTVTANNLSAQLAALTGSAEAAQQSYLDGVAFEAAQRAAEEAAQNAANPPAATPAPTTPVTPGVETPDAGTPAPSASPTPSAAPVPETPVVTPPVVVAPAPAPVVVPPVVAPPVVAPGTSGTVAAAIAFAVAQLGEPYQFGGAGPGSWDCSGLTKTSYAAAGVYIGSHGVTSQYNTMSAAGKLVPVDQRVAGDLLFYGNGSGLYHVTIYIGNGQMIEAPRPGVAVRIVGVRGGDLQSYAGRPA